MTGDNKVAPKRFWALRRGPLHPSPAEIDRAVAFLRRADRLIWFEGHAGGNEGFSASISFNPATYTGGDGDFLEVALQEASFTFEPAEPSGWSWSSYVKELVKASVDNIIVKLGRQKSQKRTGSTGGRAATSGEAGLGIAGLTAKAALQTSIDHVRGAETADAETVETSRTDIERWMEMTRPGGDFQFRLSSPPGEDLVRFNSELDRIPILSAPEPSSVGEEDVRVTMNLQIKSELRHALRIRDAGGAWEGLIQTRNRQIVSELMLSQFLKPMHQPVRLWPRKRGGGRRR